MKHILSTINYVFKNIFFLIVFAVPSSISHAFLRNSETFYDFFIFRNGEGPGFLTIYKNFSMVYTDRIWLSAITIVLYLFTIPIALSLIEKHMRIGKRSYSGMFSRLNYNVISTTLIVGLFLLIYEIWSVLLSAMLVLVGLISTSFAAVFVMLILIFGMYILLLYVISPFFVWLPCVLVTGYKYSEGFVESLRLIDRNRSRLAVSIAFPLIIFNLVQMIFKMAFGHVYFLVKVVLYLLYFMYYTALCYTVYFDLSNTERTDLQKKYYGGR